LGAGDIFILFLLCMLSIFSSKISFAFTFLGTWCTAGFLLGLLERSFFMISSSLEETSKISFCEGRADLCGFVTGFVSGFLVLGVNLTFAVFDLILGTSSPEVISKMSAFAGEGGAGVFDTDLCRRLLDFVVLVVGGTESGGRSRPVCTTGGSGLRETGVKVYSGILRRAVFPYVVIFFFGSRGSWMVAIV
jgi:hypothetical protein